MEININQPGQGPVLWRSINTNLELNFHTGSFFFFSVIFSGSNHQTVDKKNEFHILTQLWTTRPWSMPVGVRGGDVNRSNAWDKYSNVWVLYLKSALQDITTFKQLPVIGDTHFHFTNNQMQITLSLKTTAT